MTPRIQLLQRIRKIRRKNSRTYVRLRTLLVVLAFPLFYGLLLLAGLAMIASLALSVTILPIFGLILIVSVCSIVFRAMGARSMSSAAARELTKSEAPELFEEVRNIARQLKCRVPHKIEIDSAENASVQIVRCGFFTYRPMLRVGLPLMMSLRPDEFRSVIAHECGHLLRYDDLFGRILHRVEVGWIAGMDGDVLQKRRRSWLFGRFERWFWESLRIWLTAHARMAEENADTASDQLFPGAAAVRGRVALLASYGFDLSELWFADLVEREPEPIENYDRLRWQDIRENWNGNQAAVHLQRILDWPDDEFAPHPTVAQVMEITDSVPENVSLDPPPTAAESAAAYFLGNDFEKIERELDFERRAMWKKSWSDDHSARRRARVEIEAASSHSGFEVHEMLATAWQILNRNELAIPHLKALSEARPKDAAMLSRYAVVLCSTQNEEAPIVCQDVLMKFPHMGGMILDASLPWYVRAGQRAKAQSILEKYWAFLDRVDAVGAERAELRLDDTLIEHDLEPDILAQLKGGLMVQPDVVEVRIARKKLTDFHSSPVHVVILQYSGSARGSAQIRHGRNHEFANHFANLIGECFFCDNKAYSKLWKKTRKLHNSVLLVKK